jgi:hypothetical protein
MNPEVVKIFYPRVGIVHQISLSRLLTVGIAHPTSVILDLTIGEFQIQNRSFILLSNRSYDHIQSNLYTYKMKRARARRLP